MTTTFPPLPWEEGKTFTNDTTGVTYTFSDGKWLASGGPKVEGEYLPLTGGTLTGNLNVGGQLKVTGENEFKVEYADGSNFLRVRPDTSTVVVKGSLDAEAGKITGDMKVEGTVKTLNVDSAQGSNLLLKHNGNTKVYVGGTALTSQEQIIGNKGALFKNNVTIERGSGYAFEVKRGDDITAQIHSDGTFTSVRTEFSNNHLVTKKYVDDSIADINIPDVDLSGYLPLTGGNITGATTIDNGNQVALTIKNGNSEQIKFWGSGAVALTSGYTNFKDDELITKKYVDDHFVDKTGSTMTGALTVDRGNNEALIIKKNEVEKAAIWVDGTFTTTKTSFSNDNLVTKKYVDDKVASGGGGFTPGEQVAKLNGSAGVAVGGFYIQNGNVFCKVS